MTASRSGLTSRLASSAMNRYQSSEPPDHRGRLGLLHGGAVAGELAGQVVEPVAILPRADQQVRAGQLAEHRAPGRGRHVGQRRAQVAAHRRRGHGAEQPQHPRRVRRERAVGAGEHRADRARVALHGEPVEPGTGQLVGELRGRPGGLADQARGRDPQRERHSGADPREVGDGVRFARDPGPAEHLLQQRHRAGGVERVEHEVAHGVAGDEPGERAPARHDEQAGVRAGHQRQHVVDGAGVVHQHDASPGVQQGPVQRRARRLPRGDAVLGHVEAAQQVREGLLGADGVVGVVAAQVEEELAVGERARRCPRPTARPVTSCPCRPARRSPRSADRHR